MKIKNVHKEIELDDVTAKSLIDDGLAEPVKPSEEEQAVATLGEQIQKAFEVERLID